MSRGQLGLFPFICLGTQELIAMDICKMKRKSEADVAQSVGARPSELKGRQFDPHHSIDICFDFPLFCKTEH